MRVRKVLGNHEPGDLPEVIGHKPPRGNGESGASHLSHRDPRFHPERGFFDAFFSLDGVEVESRNATLRGYFPSVAQCSARAS